MPISQTSQPTLVSPAITASESMWPLSLPSLPTSSLPLLKKVPIDWLSSRTKLGVRSKFTTPRTPLVPKSCNPFTFEGFYTDYSQRIVSSSHQSYVSLVYLSRIPALPKGHTKKRKHLCYLTMKRNRMWVLDCQIDDK